MRALGVGILCHSSAGGSGVVATEVGLALARRGHRVHFVSTALPFRLASAPEACNPNIFFHEVSGLAYPLFEGGLTTIALASKLHEVIEEGGLDLVHAHYAIPHATAALLARDMSATRPPVITTLHGTDVTLVGIDKAYLRTTQYSIQQSDKVTAVSRYLADHTRDAMGVQREISVVHNLVDAERFRPGSDPALRKRWAHPDEFVLLHVSNFRQVKRTEDVVRVFELVQARVPARLIMIGDGPERSRTHELAESLGVSGRVHFIGGTPRIEPLVALADVFLLPSVQESFGLVALEAMACEVPVVASRIGGIPEVVVDGESGYLRPPGDIAGMAEAVLELLGDDALRRRMGAAGRERARTVFSEERVVPRYLAVYASALGLDPAMLGIAPSDIPA
jgi:N-acetyl-alpha-D-glucosaminyl L-malate synthase BshA